MNGVVIKEQVHYSKIRHGDYWYQEEVTMKDIIPSEIILYKIYLVRSKKVMLDKDLAELYRVETSQLKRQVRRNIERFPEDFMYELTKEEFEDLRCQFGISRWGGTRYMPMAFTEQEIAMLSSVLNSKIAIQVNIQIMRTFSSIRNMALNYEGLKKKIEKMEEQYDKHFRVVFDALRELLYTQKAPTSKIKKIGFKVKDPEKN